MQYQTVKKAVFLRRPNRFIAQVELEGAEETVHVKNTGRCRELLVPGATIYLAEGTNPSRKTRYDLIAVEKGKRLINMDAQAPNQVFGEWAAAGGFRSDLSLLRPETTWGNSRFDFYWESLENDRKGFVEVKGVTLEEGGAVYFPDAPTERGVKHVEELMACRAAGYEAALFLVVQMEGVAFWSPNDRTHPAFGEAVRRAAAAGVEILCRDCRVSTDAISMGEPVEIRL
ncbi:DNA/RNA nuclease SfsA [Intestinimonas sp. HCP28S3_D6]|uniref:DNA/RNA nuclease SfsA n=1 Tax=Intestinimonas sp. HCP28S3_D6 TaxID=3438942 RepID=UPI003F8955C6